MNDIHAALKTIFQSKIDATKSEKTRKCRIFRTTWTIDLMSFSHIFLEVNVFFIMSSEERVKNNHVLAEVFIENILESPRKHSLHQMKTLFFGTTASLHFLFVITLAEECYLQTKTKGQKYKGSLTCKGNK